MNTVGPATARHETPLVSVYATVAGVPLPTGVDEPLHKSLWLAGTLAEPPTFRSVENAWDPADFSDRAFYRSMVDRYEFECLWAQRCGPRWTIPQVPMSLVIDVGATDHSERMRIVVPLVTSATSPARMTNVYQLGAPNPDGVVLIYYVPPPDTSNAIAVYAGPVGTPLPTSFTEPLDALLVPVGWITAPLHVESSDRDGWTTAGSWLPGLTPARIGNDGQLRAVVFEHGGSEPHRTLFPLCRMSTGRNAFAMPGDLGHLKVRPEMVAGGPLIYYIRPRAAKTAAKSPIGVTAVTDTIKTNPDAPADPQWEAYDLVGHAARILLTAEEAASKIPESDVRAATLGALGSSMTELASVSAGAVQTLSTTHRARKPESDR